MTPVADNSLRQAADFIRGLDADAAEAMLCRLSTEEASALRTAISAAAEPSGPTVSSDGAVELQLDNASEAFSEDPPPAPTPPQEAPFNGVEWLRSLRDADPTAIATYLSREQPRAIAMVLGYLTPELSAGVLQNLAEHEQARVVAQLADQRDADPDSLHILASGLAEWVKQQQEETERRHHRVATIRQILAATPPQRRRRLLTELAGADPAVAASLTDLMPRQEPIAEAPLPQKRPPAAPPLPMEELSRLDGRALAEAIGRLNARTALLALAAAPEGVIERLANGLPRKAATDLRSRINRVGPTTLAEIDRAQTALAQAAGQVVAHRQTARAALAGGA
ncbi:Flagellar motor switch protein FliG [Planctomycetes bacterium MalM25]|nr:Flagellar motor switch protein FliG [Planctomycetes bacterium MalM25]